MGISKQICLTFKEHGFKLILLLLMLISIMSPWHIYIKDVLSFFLLYIVARGSYDKTSIQLCLFSFTYSLFVFINNSVSITELLSYLICPISFYLLGQKIFRESSSEDDLVTVFILIILASNVILWVNNITDSIQHGIVNVSRVIENDTQRDISATLQGLILSIGISGVAYVIVCGSIFNWKSLMMLCFSLLSLFSTIHLVNRTGMGIFAIAVIVSMLYMFRKKKIYIILSIVIMYVVYLLLNHYEIINEEVFEAYEARSFDQNTGGGRIEIWSVSFIELLNNPLGWTGVEIGFSKGFCHNLWLDIARRAGWIPFILFTIITIRKILELIKLALHSNKPFVGYFTAFITCTLTTCFLEPVIEGVSIYFYLLCFLWGIQSDLYKTNIQINEKNRFFSKWTCRKYYASHKILY